jgi:hypothetical protein
VVPLEQRYALPIDSHAMHGIISGVEESPMPRNTYTGPLPTIGYTRGQGISRIRVYCIQGCGHSGMVDNDRLGMPDDLHFVHIPTQPRLVCTSCGGRNAQVMPDWPPARRGASARLRRAAMKRLAACALLLLLGQPAWAQVSPRPGPERCDCIPIGCYKTGFCVFRPSRPGCPSCNKQDMPQPAERRGQ